MKTYASEDKFNRDTPWYWNAREFMFSSEETQNGEEEFINSLKENDEIWTAHDQEIRDNLLMSPQYRGVGITSEDLELGRISIARQAYHTALGDEVTQIEDTAFVGMDMSRAEEIKEDVTKASRSYKAMNDFASRPGQRFTDLRRVNESIESGVQNNVINQRQARMMRAVALRAFQINPIIFADFTFVYSKPELWTNCRSL